MKQPIYLPLTALRTFQVAARCHSFAVAADMLGVTGPAVSQQIKRLETEIGKQLFTRGNRKVTITKDGKVYAAKLEKVFGDLEKVLLEMSGGAK